MQHKAKLSPCLARASAPQDQGVPFVVYDPSRPELPMAVLSPLDNPMAPRRERDGSRSRLGSGARDEVRTRRLVVSCFASFLMLTTVEVTAAEVFTSQNHHRPSEGWSPIGLHISGLVP